MPLRSHRASGAIGWIAPFALVAAAATGLPGRAAAADAPARLFLDKCAECHSVGENKDLDGPDLAEAQGYKTDELTTAVEAMRDNVDEFSDAEIGILVALLADPKGAKRIHDERDGVVEAAPLAPASAETGEKLFSGATALSKGGPACAACHRVGPTATALGPSLHTIAGERSAEALTASIARSKYKVMTPVYAKAPLTRQEAAHLVAYIRAEATRPSERPTSERLVHAAAGVATLLLFAALALLARARRAGRRQNLLRSSEGR